uniref:Uncharacterized protein n=1 Tax=Parascaris equorum TaxID=6256 RepID=A0A914RWV2_PAREQ
MRGGHNKNRGHPTDELPSKCSCVVHLLILVASCCHLAIGLLTIVLFPLSDITQLIEVSSGRPNKYASIDEFAHHRR